MSKTDTGGAAQPHSYRKKVSTDVSYPHQEHGMTILDHFAGLAMQAMLTDSDSCLAALNQADALKIGPAGVIAKEAYDIAAAMVAEKRKREGGA